MSDPLHPKQVIVIRKDLNMRKGKMCAQAAHASLAVILDAQREGPLPRAIQEWLDGRFTKIVVSVNSEEELHEVYQNAKLASIPCSLIQDAGFTEFDQPTYTAVGVGPDYPEFIDQVTGELPLL